MKKLLTLILVACISASIFAQVPTSVQRNSTHSYNALISNGASASAYNWSADAALGAVITGGTTANVTIQFTGAITGVGLSDTVSVYATSTAPSLCSGNVSKKAFRIVAQLADSASLPVISAICPRTTTNATAGVLPTITVNFVTTGNVAVASTGYSYEIVGPAPATTVIASGNPAAAGTSASLAIATIFNNTQAGSYTLRVTSVTTASGISSYPNAAGTYPNTTFTVTTAPELTW